MKKPHYFAIGAFILGAVAVTVAGLVTLGAGKWFEKNTRVETYFTESVQGLEVGAPVRIRGVPVGRVESVRLAREEYQLDVAPQPGEFPYKGVVVVRMSIHPAVAGQFTEEDMNMRMKMAADAGFRFRLASHGITGVLYIESDFLDPAAYPPMQIAWTPKSPYIPSAPSAITIIGAAVNNIVKNLEHVPFTKLTHDFDALLASVTRLIDDADRAQLAGQAKETLGALHATILQTRRLIESPDLADSLKNVAAATGDIRKMAANFTRAGKDIDTLIARLSTTLDHADKSVRRIDAVLASRSQDIEELVENLRVVSEELRQVTKNAERYPAQVFFGDPPPHAKTLKR